MTERFGKCVLSPRIKSAEVSISGKNNIVIVRFIDVAMPIITLIINQKECKVGFWFFFFGNIFV